MESTLTSKGQITLPKALRDDLHLRSGDRVAFDRNDDGSYVLRPKTVRAASLAGYLKDFYTGPPKTLEDMDRAIAENAGRRNR